MQIKVRAEDDKNSTYSPVSSGNTFITDQAGLLGNLQSAQWRSDIARNSFDASALMMAREMEKRRIREEMMESEFWRRRELEAEVMREMMVEREILLRRGGGGGSSLVDSSLLRPELVQGVVTALGSFPAGMSRPEGEIDWKASPVSRHEGGVLGAFPFQRQPGAAANAVTARANTEQSEEQLVKHTNSILAGTKRKPEAEPVESGDGNPPSVKSVKKSNNKWECSLCQVTVTSEQVLKDHLNGKKHKAKGKALLSKTISKSASDNGDNSEAFAEETENSNELVEPTGNLRPNQGKHCEGNVEDMNVPEAVEQGEEHKDNQGNTDGNAEASDEQATAELGTEYKYWCKVCNVGTTSETSMTVHRMGKKHVAMLLKNGGGVISIKTMPDEMQYIRNNKTEEKEESLGKAEREAEGAGADQKEDGGAGGEQMPVSGS